MLPSTPGSSKLSLSQSFPNKTLHAFHFSPPTRATCLTHLFLRIKNLSHKLRKKTDLQPSASQTMYTHTVITSIHVPCIFYYSVLWPPNAQLFNKLSHSYMFRRGPGSVVGTATGYGLDGPGVESRWGRDFPHLSRPALEPTQPPVQWGTGSFPGVKRGRGVTLTSHPF
jgi:hypothetical protein